MYQGVYTALVTPFTREGTVDVRQLQDLVEMQLEAGVNGLVPVGTTGESPVLSPQEVELVIRTVVHQVNGRVPVIAGTGSNCTAKTVDQTRRAQDLGADGVLVVVPYYNKPTQQGIYGHFMEVADASNVPVILYDVPGRTAAYIENSTLLRLAQHERITSLKAASGNLSGIMELISTLADDFSILSGDDNLVFPMMALGGHGVISVVSNLYPRQMVQLTSLCLRQQWMEARAVHYEMLPIFRAAFIETNPIPIKAAMAIKGYINEVYRKPLCAMDPLNRDILENVVRSMPDGY